MTEQTHWTAADRRAVTDYMGNVANLPERSAVELVAENERRHTAADEGLSRRYPTWTPEQLGSLRRFSNSYFTSTDAIARGIARRIALESPTELATFLSFVARYEWALTGHTRTVPEVQRERYFLPILQAVAANDLAVAQRFAESALAAPARKPTAKDYAALTGGVLALLHQDEGELTRAVAAMDRCKPKAYIAGMFETLRGAAGRSPERVTAGLQMVLKAYPKYVFDDRVLRLVDPHAHGLFQLCQRYSAELTSQFDVGRGPPWDPGFYAWWRTDHKPLADMDLTAIDPEAQRVLIRLDQPVWWNAEESAAW